MKTQPAATPKGRNLERIFVLLNTIILGLLFYTLYGILEEEFIDVPQRLANGSMINLNEEDPGARMRSLMQHGYYLEDPRDVALVSNTVAERSPQFGGTMDNIGELNKRAFAVPAADALNKGGQLFQRRAIASRMSLGFTGDDSLRWFSEQKAPPSFPATVQVNVGKGIIEGEVHQNDEPFAGVLVRLQMVPQRDTTEGDAEEEGRRRRVEEGIGFKKTFYTTDSGTAQLQNLVAYARTDAAGKFFFNGLPEGRGYEVLPLKPGLQFGASKGVVNLDGEEKFSFTAAPHTVRLFSSRDFQILKRERSLIVRTPEYFTRWYWIIAIGLLAGFLILHLLFSIRFPQADKLILPVVQLLVGLSFITLLSLQDPLRDRFLAQSMLSYFGIGAALLIMLLFLPLQRFTTDSKLYRLFAFTNNDKAANGWPWAVGAVGLLLLTILFGTGPEGSGVKVNLFGFQPSEIVKYLIIIFLAGFFATNEKFIAEYRTYSKRWSFFAFALIAIVLSILLFLVLGDLGPAMVICFTFIILFSFSRGDFFFTLGAVLFYVAALWLIKNTWISTGVTFAAVAIAMLFVRKQLSESAAMALVLMAGFMLLDQVPLLDKLFPGPVQRLVDRKSIWQNAWDNEVFGGDQVANGIWAMSSGGVTGQGVGEGFAKTIPEAHTDMILPSLGEEFGWTGIVCIFILFLLFLHRSIIIGRSTGRPFLFYLAAGIGISTFVQFMLIAGGSTGALPLSGVALPFVSYGGSSLVANLLAAGFLLSVSSIRGSQVQMEYVSRRQDRNLVPALIAALIGIVLLSVNVGLYLFKNEKWVVQPALVADRSGARMFSYNPRIAILMNKLDAGSLFDRKGRVLATSKPQLVRVQRDSLRSAGINNYNLDSAVRKRLRRLYPFGAQTFFWVGDENTGIFNGSNNGYFAEYAHGPELRGFRTPIENSAVTASRFRETRFSEQEQTEMTVSRIDYSALAPLLLAGINSNEVEKFKQRNRDVHLTVDARLQTTLQNRLATDDSLQDNRVSVVVMEDNTGDVLASAMYPLPNINNWEEMTMSAAEINKLAGWHTNTDLGFTYATQPGSTVKVLTSLAAFNKLGLAADKVTYPVRDWERIRTKGLEPDETGTIGMERAIVKSNNVYFIKLANEKSLAEDMATLYLQTGMFLRGVGGYLYSNENPDAAQWDRWRQLWRRTEFNTRPRYNPNNIRLTRAKGISGMAWGQGELIATPAAVARLASGVANGGKLVGNRYVWKVSDSLLPVKPSVQIAKDPQAADYLTKYMKAQSANKVNKLKIAVAGKTGTPERVWRGERINDGWYVFFAPKATGTGHIVVCVRIEQTKGSSDAVKLAGDHVVPLLLQLGYIKSFEMPKGVAAPADSSEVDRGQMTDE